MKSRLLPMVLALVAASAWPCAVGRLNAQRGGQPAVARRLIIHADDLGMSHSVNRATFEALEQHWITSSSILVPCPWFPEVARWAQQHQDADLGIHLALNSEWTTFRWGPISPRDAVSSLLDKDGYLPLEETEVASKANAAEAERELRAQVEKARAAGIHLTHLDSHMATLFRTRELTDVYLRLGAAYNLPQLLERAANETHSAPWASEAQANALIDRVISIDPGRTAAQWLDTYKKMLAPLPAGTYQMIVHLGYDDEEMRGATADHPNWGAAWRQQDFDMVRSAAFRDFLREQKFVLIGWKDLAKTH